LDYTSVDLANDGKPMPVFRWDLSDRLGYRNQLILPPSTPDEIGSGKSFPDDVITRLSGANAKNVLTIDRSTSDFGAPDAYPMNGTFDWNLFKVGNKVFLLGAGSQDAERTATQGGGFDAFVMEYHSMRHVIVICQFRGGEKHK
jgi:hypothetical protein